MRKHILYLLIGIFINLNVYAIYYPEAADSLLNEGPYIFKVDNILTVKWIENCEFLEEDISADNFDKIRKKFNLSVNYDDLRQTYSIKPDYEQSYTSVDSIGVITDIHGEYNIYIDLLKAAGIIDRNLNWKFGKGHLVVLGDIFDRGSMVNEVLWHLFGLEKQAEKAGGMVHVLLGNHEFLVLRKDLSFINEKYKEDEAISKIRYFDLYSENSVLGKWLRSKPVMITIDNIIFVHAGVSTEMIQRNLSIGQINRKFSNDILGKNLKQVNSDEELFFLNESNGPLWYRGYFVDTTFCESRIDSVLEFYCKDHIVVGHTINNGINSLFNNKILGVDIGITNQETQEILLFKNGSFYKSLITGERIKL
jgi:hypothetical protein